MENIVGGIIGSWMCIVTIIFLVYIRQNNDIINIGPNPDFYIFGVCINTIPKYGIVVSFCFINSGIRAMKGNVLQSWIINEIQDVKNKNIINHNKAYTLSCISVLYNWFDFFMYMNILLSQIDMLLVEIFADILVTFYLTKYYLRCKITEENQNHQYSIID